MGVAQAGIAFRVTAPISDFAPLITKLFGEEANEIAHPNSREFDIRKHTDVMVQVFGDICFICNNDVAWDYLENQEKDTSALYQDLGSPELILAFCHYESGGSYGYSFIENGKRTRTRLQTTGLPKLPPLLESGTSKDFENHWLTADFFIEDDDCPEEERQKIYYQEDRKIQIPEWALTSRMLYEALQNNFSVCPWETDMKPTYHFFKLFSTLPPTAATTPKVSHAAKPWWKIF